MTDRYDQTRDQTDVERELLAEYGHLIQRRPEPREDLPFVVSVQLPRDPSETLREIQRFAAAAPAMRARKAKDDAQALEQLQRDLPGFDGRIEPDGRLHVSKASAKLLLDRFPAALIHTTPDPLGLAALTVFVDAWTCRWCGSHSWVGFRAGQLAPRRAQCVPCGHVGDLPEGEPQ